MKILVIQQKMIGDVLTTSILFRALREKYPQAALHYLIYKHSLPVVAEDPNIDQYILFDPDRDRSITGFSRFTRKVKAEKYDVVLDVYSKINTALVSWLSGASKRISYRKWYTRWAYTDSFHLKTTLATPAGFAIENRMMLLQGLSDDFPVEARPKIYLTKEERQAAVQLLEKEGITHTRPLIMCGILGSGPAKTYPLHYMATILDYLVERTGGQLLFNYIPNQVEEARKLLEYCSPTTREHVFFQLFGKDLREFMALTSHCDALIGNEGGAVNMAKALDVPTFSIFSPQIKKENWSIYEDGKEHVSVHIRDYRPSLLEGLTKSEITKKSGEYYELLKPNLIFAPLEAFLRANTANRKKKDNIEP